MKSENVETPWLGDQSSIQSYILSVLFFVLAIGAGVVASLVGRELGWISLFALPGLVVGVAILLQPDFGVAAFSMVIYFQLKRALEIYHPGFPGYLSPAYPLLGALVFLIVWRLFIYGDRPEGWKRTSFIFILTAFWLFSAITAGDPVQGMVKFQKYAENSLFAFVIVFFLQRPTSLKRVLWSLLVAGIFTAGLTVFQNLTSTFSSNYAGFAQWEYSSTNGSTNYRAAGLYGNANAYAQSLIVLVPIALDRVWHEKRTLTRAVAVVALTVCTLAIFFTYSRNGFVTLVFTLGFLIAMRRPNIMPLAITGVLALLLLQFMPATYSERLSTLFQFSSSSPTSVISDQSFRGRMSENIAALQMFQDNPLFGVGLDNFEVNYQDYSRKIGLDPRRTARAPASFYLELLSEQGLVGTTVFLFFIVMVFRSLWRARNLFALLSMEDEAHLTLAYISGLLGYMFFYISKSGSYSNAFWILLGIALSFEQVAINSRNSRQEDRFSIAQRL
jgi:putative inorganic carbon (HCO3(-)) transporter